VEVPVNEAGTAPPGAGCTVIFRTKELRQLVRCTAADRSWLQAALAELDAAAPQAAPSGAAGTNANHTKQTPVSGADGSAPREAQQPTTSASRDSMEARLQAEPPAVPLQSPRVEAGPVQVDPTTPVAAHHNAQIFPLDDDDSIEGTSPGRNLQVPPQGLSPCAASGVDPLDWLLEQHDLPVDGAQVQTAAPADEDGNKAPETCESADHGSASQSDAAAPATQVFAMDDDDDDAVEPVEEIVDKACPVLAPIVRKARVKR